ncbi:MAG: SPFH domain-containing protein [Chloroflexota bacterium]
MDEVRRNNFWGSTALFLVFVSIWLGGLIIERINFVERPPTVWLTEILIAPDLWGTLPGQLMVSFMPRVMRHLIPFVIGWYLARQAALDLITALFDLGNQQEAQHFLSRIRSGTVPIDKVERIDRKNFAKDRLRSTLLRYGGPGLVMVNQGDVIVTENNGRFSRVLGAGVYPLNRHEYVRSVLDLRPQERSRRNVKVMTRDGIELRSDITITFQINRGETTPTQANPYPVDNHSVWQAAYSETVLVDHHLESWEEIPMRTVIRSMVDYVGGRSLSRFLFPANQELKPHEILRNRLMTDGKSALRAHGVELLDIRLGRIIVPDEVTQQLIDKWQMIWNRRRQESDRIEPYEVESRIWRELLAQLKGYIETGHSQIGNEKLQALNVVERLNQLTQSNTKMPLLESQIAAIRERIQEENSR